VSEEFRNARASATGHWRDDDHRKESDRFAGERPTRARLLVEAIDDDIVVLIWRPENWTEDFAGRLTDVFGTHDENIRYLEGERRSWVED
jgi:hypothetical protein